MNPKGCMFFLVMGVLLLAVGAAFLHEANPGVQSARAAKARAEARIEQAKATEAEAWAAAWSATAEERAQTMTAALWGLLLFTLAGLALAEVGVLLYLRKRAQLVYPNKAGQMPVIRVSGPGWAGLVDPNRAAGHVTMIGQGPAVSQPLALSEPGHVALGQQASAVAAVAAASQGQGFGTGRASLDVASMMQPQSLAAPLPAVTEVDPAHIDRLLELTGPASEVTP